MKTTTKKVDLGPTSFERNMSMNIESLFTNLSFGELQNLSLSEEGSGTIVIEQQNRLISLTNQGLIRLFSRFNLLEKEVIIAAEDHITLYYLKSRHAKTNEEEGYPKYIQDTEDDPFVDDVIKVLTVYNEIGERLPLNDESDEKSLYVPIHDCMQIPYPVTGNSYFIMYQARHPLLVPGDLGQLIILPPALESALQAFVAHRVFSGMNGQEHLARSQGLLSKYEMICSEVEQKDLANSSKVIEHHKFTERGWR